MTPATSGDTKSVSWRLPIVIALCGCAISVLTFGPRSSLGFFLTPLSQANGWGRDIFAFSIALQNLIWGIGQPFAGAIADRYGAGRVLSAGAVLYALGLYVTSIAASPLVSHLSAGVLVGLGLSGCAVPMVIGALAKLLPDDWRLFAFGAVTAAGSFGQFLFSPLAVHLMGSYGWQNTLVMFACVLLLVVPLSMALIPPRRLAGAPAPVSAPQPLATALAEAFGHRSYVLLVLGFFTCGFQLAFVTAHLPSYLADRGISAEIGGWTMAIIGLFNIVGSLASGWLATFLPKRYILSFIYFVRALSIVAYVSVPATPTTTLVFGAVTGLLWLSTVAPTSGLVAVMFGTRWLTMLFGFAFFSHQVGGFLGVWLGGLLFETTGSYDVVWWLSVVFGVLSAIINLPIVEKPVERIAPAPA